MIPDKNLFIVSSSLKPKIGIFDNSTRINQTLETFKSIKRVPNSIILFADSSSDSITQEDLKPFEGYIDIFLRQNLEIKD